MFYFDIKTFFTLVSGLFSTLCLPMMETGKKKYETFDASSSHHKISLQYFNFESFPELMKFSLEVM